MIWIEKLSWTVMRLLLPVVLLIAIAQNASGQENPADLKKLSLEDLMNVEVMSVSRRMEKIVEAPSAIQVVNNKDIQRFGATNIPEALYLAGNLQVAQKGAHSWGVTARGFNTDLANKLLVMIDGRTVYTPLFSGVFWDRQDYLLEDVNQIEVVSGPGGTLWGANAVNGVINITTKNAKNTQGLFLQAAGGNELNTLLGGRYGGKISRNTFYRVYGKYGNRDAAVYTDSNMGANDAWQMTQGGFRIDSEPSSRDRLTLQGDIYKNNGDVTTGGTSTVLGYNVLGRWTRTFADSSNISVQAYLDKTDLDLPTAPFVINGLVFGPAGTFSDKLTTYDVDFQHQFKTGMINRIVWGAGLRRTHDEVTNAPALGFLPTLLDQNLYSFFVQDEVDIRQNFHVTVGTKLEHNAFVGYVWEPSARLRWELNENVNVWGAISRAVRTPSRIDRQLTQGTPPVFQLLTGSNDFVSETVVSTEAGVRSRMGDRTRIAVSFYYNQYNDIRSTILNPTTIFPLHFANGLMGTTYGFELTVTSQLTDWWQLYSSYNLLREDIKVREGESDFNNAHNETADPAGQFTFRSTFQISKIFSVSGAFRWVDSLPINSSGMLKTVPAYSELDGQIAWQATKQVELSISGRNLLQEQHVEYGAPGPAQESIQRSVFAKLNFRL